MRATSLMRAGLPAFSLLLVALGASGCHTYKYFDVTAQLDANTWTRVVAYSIGVCQVKVTGADTDTFVLDSAKCPERDPAKDINQLGKFEFSTFADSGDLTFQMLVFQGQTAMPACEIGEGSASVAVTSSMTSIATVTVEPMGQGCMNIMPIPIDANANPNPG